MNDSFFKFPSTPHLAALPDVDIREDKVLSESERFDFLRHSLVVKELKYHLKIHYPLIQKEIFAHRTEGHTCIHLDQDSGKNLMTGWNPVSICCLKFFPRSSFFSVNGAMPSTQFSMIVCLTGFLVSIFTINGLADFFLPSAGMRS